MSDSLNHINFIATEHSNGNINIENGIESTINSNNKPENLHVPLASDVIPKASSFVTNDTFSTVNATINDDSSVLVSPEPRRTNRRAARAALSQINSQDCNDETDFSLSSNSPPSVTSTPSTRGSSRGRGGPGSRGGIGSRGGMRGRGGRGGRSGASAAAAQSSAGANRALKILPQVQFNDLAIPIGHNEDKSVDRILAYMILSVDLPMLLLVKYQNLSFMHREWVPEHVVQSESNGPARIKRFISRGGRRIEPTEQMLEFFGLPLDYAENPMAFASRELFATGSGPLGINYYDDGFDTAFLKARRIIAETECFVNDVKKRFYLVKWGNLSYDKCTWEYSDFCLKNFYEHVDYFVKTRRPPPCKLDTKNIQANLGASGLTFTSSSSNSATVAPCALTKKQLQIPFARLDQWKRFETSPPFCNDNKLRAYQLEGVNWLIHCWLRDQSCIMADEMGLGKTIQSVAFLYELYRTFHVPGPFLVVAPLSTVPHWERVFRKWTDLNVVVYHGNDVARSIIYETEFFFDKELHETKGIWPANAAKRFTKLDVLITTYEMTSKGALHLRRVGWRAGVFDEAHKLKNKTSKVAEVLKTFDIDFSLLLTGTPLQNCLNELWALLNFLQPHRFPSEEQFMAQYGSLRDSDDVQRLQQLLKPLMLRRLKEDVEKSIPVKEETVVEVELTNTQKRWYRAILERNFTMLKKGFKGRDSVPSLTNIVMELRKCCIHPYLLEGAEAMALEEANATTHESQFECMVNASGKLVLLDKLLKKLYDKGHKVLIFSQMTKCLDILSDYLRGRKYEFERIDGNIRGVDRQAAIDRFSEPNSSKFVFLLCTRAGGVGINLTAADTAIIFDSDWNPQNDLQAQARCHRIGQTKPVQIYRLITRNSYEKEMFERAGMKLGLDKAVLQKMDANSVWTGTDDTSTKLSNTEVEELLKKGAYGALLDDNESNAFCEEDIEEILNKRTKVIRHDNSNAKGSIFSKATFTSADNAEIDVNDPMFWDKFAERASINVQLQNEAANSVLPYGTMEQQEQQFHLQQLQLQQQMMLDETDSKTRQRRFLPRLAAAAAAAAANNSNQNCDAYNSSNSQNLSSSPDRTKRGGDECMAADALQGGREELYRWTTTEKLYFERRLMVYGLYRWEMLQKYCGRRSVNDLRVCARDLIRFLISTLDPKEDVNLIADCEAAVQLECDPYCAPYETGVPYNNATARQITEYRSFLHEAPQEYKEYLERKSRFMLARVQLLKQVHDLVPLTLDIEVARESIVVPAITRPPAPWWGVEEDRDLLIGIVKYGYHIFKPMRTDPQLCFCKKKYDPASLVNNRKRCARGASGDTTPGRKAATGNTDDQSDDNLEEDEAQCNNPNDEQSDLEQDDNVNSNLTSSALGENLLAQSSTGTLSSEVLYFWPSKSEIGSRLRRVVNALVREKRRKAQQERKLQELAAIAASSSSMLPAASMGGIGEDCGLIPGGVGGGLKNARAIRREAARRARSAGSLGGLGVMGISGVDGYSIPGDEYNYDINDDPTSIVSRARRWNKRERIEFYRVLTTLGVHVETLEDGVTKRINWSMIREMANLSTKSDSQIYEFYNHLIALSYYFIEVDTAKSRSSTLCRRPKFVFDGDEEYTLDKSKKLFKRLEFMDYLRSEVLPYEHLDRVLSQAKRSPGLPDWWQNSIHDSAILQGIAKHGYGRFEQVVRDPEFNFYYMAANHRTKYTEADYARLRSTHCIIDGLPFPKETVINKRIGMLCRLAGTPAKPNYELYVPPCYVEPEMETMDIANTELDPNLHQPNNGVEEVPHPISRSRVRDQADEDVFDDNENIKFEDQVSHKRLRLDYDQAAAFESGVLVADNPQAYVPSADPFVSEYFNQQQQHQHVYSGPGFRLVIEAWNEEGQGYTVAQQFAGNVLETCDDGETGVSLSAVASNILAATNLIEDEMCKVVDPPANVVVPCVPFKSTHHQLRTASAQKALQEQAAKQQVKLQQARKQRLLLEHRHQQHLRQVYLQRQLEEQRIHQLRRHQEQNQRVGFSGYPQQHNAVNVAAEQHPSDVFAASMCTPVIVDEKTKAKESDEEEDEVVEEDDGQEAERRRRSFDSSIAHSITNEENEGEAEGERDEDAAHQEQLQSTKMMLPPNARPQIVSTLRIRVKAMPPENALPDASTATPAPSQQPPQQQQCQ